MNNKIWMSLFIGALLSTVSFAQQKKDDPKATELWTPIPKIVTPGSSNSDAPSDAIVLFDGKNLNEWRSAKDTATAAGWTVSKGIITVKKGTGDIQTNRLFTDYQLHIEWCIPKNISGSGQARGNSGVFLAAPGSGNGGYEIQVLDCYNNTTYVNGQTASIYKQHIPLANACKKPGEWQTYEIVWTAPRFNDDGSLKTLARVTAIHNGVLVQNNVEVKGSTMYIGPPAYKMHGPSPIKLQDHGDPSEPISYRNIWVREL